MAVYTHVPAETIAALLKGYGLGGLRSAKGIAEGVENSNYLVDADGGRFILTLYEKRVDPTDLPFFLGLLDHLAARGLPVPRALRDRAGRQVIELCGRPACLIEFLEGVSLSAPTGTQAEAAGAALAAMHDAVADFPGTRANALGQAAWAPLLARCGRDLDGIAPGLHDRIARALDTVTARWPAAGETCVIHADLFPDNVLMTGDRVTGLIDFYFACTDLRLYDLAVTHGSWSFDGDGRRFDASIGRGLIAGYAGLAGLPRADAALLPVLAMGACIRFALTRAWDWLNTPADALVTRKDPLAYVRRLDFYAEAGAGAFA